MTDNPSPDKADELVERLRERARAASAEGNCTADVDAICFEDAATEITTIRAQLAAAEENTHLANGVAELAMKHRDAAETALASARKALESWKRWASTYKPDETLGISELLIETDRSLSNTGEQK